ncbi:GD23259 [Drosophila simulans]|uniref:GD23259 n=1 Tax=Drosophila simulans TaxID=7240 RepID=B4QA33_DROSI|nr:GD23259 [Drosophila simulans]
MVDGNQLPFIIRSTPADEILPGFLCILSGNPDANRMDNLINKSQSRPKDAKYFFMCLGVELINYRLTEIHIDSGEARPELIRKSVAKLEQIPVLEGLTPSDYLSPESCVLSSIELLKIVP